MSLIKNIYHVLSIFTILISLIIIKRKIKITKENFVIIHTILIFNFFDIFIWILPRISESIKIGLLAYEILFPAHIISIILVKKNTNLISVLIIIISIASQYILRSSNQIQIENNYIIGLSFFACMSILLMVFKNIKKIRYQVFMLLIISGIPLIDMFITASYIKLIPFQMNTWNVFLSCYTVFLSFICFIFIYYYGKQLLKNSTSIN